MPLEWDLTSNINLGNAETHLGKDRLSWYDYADVSTAHASFFQQGQCDPNETDQKAKSYYPGCFADNNNISTGGVVHPGSTTNQGLYEKSADISVILKPLFESHQDVKTLGFYFSNEGAGATVSFPADVRDGTLNYTSIGCDWMRNENLVSRNGAPIGTNDEIRKCQDKGKTVFARRYNPLERAWCRDQALNPGQTRMSGPYLDASSEHLWLLTIGRAVYDRLTRNFIGCTLLDVSIQRIESVLEDVEVGDTSEVALVRWDDGTVVASPQWDSLTARETVKIDEIDVGIDDDTFQKIKDIVDFKKMWEPEEVEATYKKTIVRHKGRLVATYPVPVPIKYVESYQPEYLVVLTIEEQEVYRTVDNMDQSIDEDSDDIVKRTLIIGFCGMALVLAIVVLVSLFLTKPLAWMAEVADQIVSNAGHKNLEEGVDMNGSAFYLFTPRTELTQLVTEFRHMVQGIGGSGAAKVAASTATTDVLNTVPWFGEVFGAIYHPKDGCPRWKGGNKSIGAWRKICCWL